ncbi:Histone-lysine N-methyltransferase 2C, partial [Dissostichus eleginoides]
AQQSPCQVRNTSSSPTRNSTEDQVLATDFQHSPMQGQHTESPTEAERTLDHESPGSSSPAGVRCGPAQGLSTLNLSPQRPASLRSISAPCSPSPAPLRATKCSLSQPASPVQGQSTKPLQLPTQSRLTKELTGTTEPKIGAQTLESSPSSNHGTDEELPDEPGLSPHHGPSTPTPESLVHISLTSSPCETEEVPPPTSFTQGVPSCASCTEATEGSPTHIQNSIPVETSLAETGPSAELAASIQPSQDEEMIEGGNSPSYFILSETPLSHPDTQTEANSVVDYMHGQEGTSPSFSEPPQTEASSQSPTSPGQSNVQTIGSPCPASPGQTSLLPVSFSPPHCSSSRSASHSPPRSSPAGQASPVHIQSTYSPVQRRSPSLASSTNSSPAHATVLACFSPPHSPAQARETPRSPAHSPAIDTGTSSSLDVDSSSILQSRDLPSVVRMDPYVVIKQMSPAPASSLPDGSVSPNQAPASPVSTPKHSPASHAVDATSTPASPSHASPTQDTTAMPSTSHISETQASPPPCTPSQVSPPHASSLHSSPAASPVHGPVLSGETEVSPTNPLRLEGGSGSALRFEASPGSPLRCEASPGSPLWCEASPGSTVQLEASSGPGSPLRLEASPGSPLWCEETPGSSLRCEETPGSPLRCEETPGSPLRCEETPGSPLRREETPGSPLRREETPGSPLRCEETPGSPLRCEETPGSPLRCVEIPGSPLRCEANPGSPLRLEASPGSPLRCEASPGSPLRLEASPGSPLRCEASPGSPLRLEASPGSPLRPEASPGSPLRCEASPEDSESSCIPGPTSPSPSSFHQSKRNPNSLSCDINGRRKPITEPVQSTKDEHQSQAEPLERGAGHELQEPIAEEEEEQEEEVEELREKQEDQSHAEPSERRAGHELQQPIAAEEEEEREAGLELQQPIAAEEEPSEREAGLELHEPIAAEEEDREDLDDQSDVEELEMDASLDLEVMALMTSPSDDLSIRLRSSPSPPKPPQKPPPSEPTETTPLSKPPSLPLTVLPHIPKIGMGKPAITKRKFSPGRARVKQSSWWSSRRVVSPPSSSQDSMGEAGCESPKHPDSPLWSVKV